MKKYVLFYLLSISFILSYSQVNFHKSYDIGSEDYGNKVIGSTQGIYLAGSTNKVGAGSYDMFLTKLDSSGAVVWNTQFGTADFDAGRSVTPFQQVGFIVAGTTTGSSASHKSDVVISLLDSLGGYQGSAYYGFDSLAETATDVVSVGDTDLIIVGTSQANTDGSHNNMLIIRTDGQANVRWAKTYGTPTANSQAVRIFNIPGAGFIAIGISTSNGPGNDDGWIMNFDDDGNIQNQILIGRAFYDDGRFFTFADNKIIFGGVAGSIGGPNRSNIFILALDPNTLSPVWSKTYGGDSSSSLSFLSGTMDNNLMVGGNRKVPGNGEDGIVFKVNAGDGSVIWSKSFGTTGDEYASDGTLLEDGSVVLTGEEDVFGSSEINAYVARISDAGNLCDGMDIGLEVRDQTDSILGPVVPGLRDSVVNLTKNDIMLTANSYTVTVNEHCTATPVKQASKNNTIHVYPNPTSGKVFIESSTVWSKKINMSIYNLLGAEIFSRSIEPGVQNFSIDLSGSPKGMYIISFNDGTTITTEKIRLN